MGKIVIGLTGSAGVGKSAFARELVANHGFKRMALADPLKLMLRGLLSTWGYNEWACDYWIDGEGKEKPCPALQHQTPRHAMQLLGTEYGREGLGSEVWVRHLIRRIDASPFSKIVVDDIRYDNEAEAITTDLNGINFRVVAADGKAPKRNPGEHASEAGVSMDLIDGIVINDFTFEGVAEQIREAVIPLSRAA